MAPVVHGESSETKFAVSKAKPLDGKTVTVRQGDALYKIARRHNVNLRSLIDANALKPPYTIYPGQKLRLPSSRVHVVRRGESVYQISDLYNIQPGVIVRLNRIRTPYRLSPGQTLVLPENIKQPRRRVSSSAIGSSSSLTDSRGQRQARDKKSSSVTRKSERRAELSKPGVKLPTRSRGGFVWPLNGRVLSRFGAIGKGLQNDGINIQAKKGTPVRAIQSGVVAYAGNELRGFGNLLLVKHTGGWISAYAHNSELLVRMGQVVARGQVISKVGRTGNVDKPQLHFELRRGNRAVNPERYLGRQSAEVRN